MPSDLTLNIGLKERQKQATQNQLLCTCVWVINKVKKCFQRFPAQAVPPLWHPLLVRRPVVSLSVFRLCSWAPITNQLWPSDSKTVSLAATWLHTPLYSLIPPPSLPLFCPAPLTHCQHTDRSSLQLSLQSSSQALLYHMTPYAHMHPHISAQPWPEDE